MGRKFEFDFTPFNFDQIREMNDDDLYKNINAFRRKIREAARSGKDTQPYEVEFCYLEHERVMRERSSQASKAFSRKKIARSSKEK